MRTVLPLFLVLLLLPAAPVPADAPVETPFRLTMSDGVTLDATLVEPAGAPPAAGWPTVMIAHGYGGAKDVDAARALAAEGFAGFAWSARGFGESGGRMDLVGPRSVQDVRELAQRLPALGPVDPARVALVGASYGGAHALAAAVDPDMGFATVVAIATWSDLAHGLRPHDVSKLSYTTGFYLGGHALTQQRCACDSYAPEIHRWFAEAALGVGTDDVDAGLRSRSTLQRAALAEVPVFLVQGLNDDLFSGEHALWFHEAAVNAPTRVHLGFVGHPRAVADGAEVEYLWGEIHAWLARYLRDEGPLPFDPARPIEVASHPWDGRVDALARWPRGEEGTFLAFTADHALAPQAGPAPTVPHAVTNTFAAGIPDDAAFALVAPDALTSGPSGTPVDTLAYRLSASAHARTLLGTPRAELTLTSSSPVHQVHVKLFDVAPDGHAALVTRGAFGVRDGAPGVPFPVTFDLPPVHHTLAPGHALEVRVAASDFPAFAPERVPFTTALTVGGADASGVRLPFTDA